VRTMSKFVWAGFLMCPSFLCHMTLNLEELGSQEELVLCEANLIFTFRIF